MTVELTGVYKKFNTPSKVIEVLKNVSLVVEKGRFVSLIGPSGCGKSTVFRIMCGLTDPDRGEVLIDGLPARQPGKSIAYMPQKDLLMPWRTVLENVTLAGEIAGLGREAARRKALPMLSLFGLEGFENSYPHHLSGGMSQRAALLRTVLTGRGIMLLDEPFGALDAITRFRMQQWLQEIWIKLGKTVVFITHDVDEAIFLSDSVYVMSPRPGAVRRKFDVPFPRPRVSSLLTGGEYAALKKDLIDMLAENPV